MLSVSYYHSLIKKYVVVFGTLFNQIKIQRFNVEEGTTQNIRIPIAYGPKEKFLARFDANPTGIASQSIMLPRIAFELTGLQYAPDRKLQTTVANYTANNVNGRAIYKKVYQPVPYDLQFTLSVIARTTEDATKIVEQILPYFTPEWTVSARLLQDYDLVVDLPIVLNSVNIDDNYESDFKTRRTLIYTLVFTLKGYFYGPTTQAKIIKYSTVQLHTPNGNISSANSSDPVVVLTVQPGMDANGVATTNAAASISYLDIDENDDWEYIVTKNDYVG
jgi:hypothetical protein